MVPRFRCLKFGLALVLVFIGARIFLGDRLFSGQVPAVPVPAVTVAPLAGGILFRLWQTRAAKARLEGSAA